MKVLVFNGKHRKDYHLRALRLKEAPSQKNVLDTITNQQVHAITDKRVLSILIPLQAKNYFRPFSSANW